MATFVIPFHVNGKTRLGDRGLAQAMLADVQAAAAEPFLDETRSQHAVPRTGPVTAAQRVGDRRHDRVSAVARNDRVLDVLLDRGLVGREEPRAEQNARRTERERRRQPRAVHEAACAQHGDRSDRLHDLADDHRRPDRLELPPH